MAKDVSGQPDDTSPMELDLKAANESEKEALIVVPTTVQPEYEKLTSKRTHADLSDCEDQSNPPKKGMADKEVLEQMEALKVQLAQMATDNKMLKETIVELQAAGGAAKKQPTVDADGFITVGRGRGGRPRAQPSNVQLPVSNQFEALPVEVVQQKARPCNVYVAATAQVVMQKLRGIPELQEKGSYSISSVQGGRATVQAKNEELGELIKKTLMEAEIGYFERPRRGAGPLKVELRGMSEFDAETVMKLLTEEEDMVVKPVNVTRTKRAVFNPVTKRLEKKDLPFYTVTFPQGTKSEQVSCCRYTQNLRMKFVALRKSNQPLQCYNCQRWGHSQTTCRMPARCLKCSLGHATRDCRMINEDSPKEMLKCANCDAYGHPANYSKCPKALEHARQREKTRQTTRQAVPQAAPARPVQTPAQAARMAYKNSQGVPAPVNERVPLQGAWAPRQQCEQQTVQEMLSTLMNRMEEQWNWFAQSLEDQTQRMVRIARAIGRPTLREEEINDIFNV